MAAPGPAVPLNVLDALSVKKELDMVAIQLLVEPCLGKPGFVENPTLANRRLLLEVVTVCIGLAVQFAPIPLPRGRTTLGALVVLFFICNTGLVLMSMFAEKDFLLCTKINRALGVPALRIRSTMGKYDSLYRLVFEAAATGQVLATLEHSVGKYFTKDGDFASAYFSADLDAALLVVQELPTVKRTPSKQSESKKKR